MLCRCCCIGVSVYMLYIGCCRYVGVHMLLYMMLLYTRCCIRVVVYLCLNTRCKCVVCVDYRCWCMFISYRWCCICVVPMLLYL